MASMKLLSGVVCLALVAAAYCETPGTVDATTEKYHDKTKEYHDKTKHHHEHHEKTKEYHGHGKEHYEHEQYNEQYEHNYDDEPYFSGKYYKTYTPPSSPEYPEPHYTETETPGYNPHPKYPHEEEHPEHHYSRGKDYSQKDVTFDLKEDTAATTPELHDDYMGVGKTSIRTAGLLGSQHYESTVSQVTVGSVAWSGSITKSSTAADKADAKLNWLITFKITHKDWVGEIIAAGHGVSQYSTTEQEFPIVGGLGVFEGATGRVLFKPLLNAEDEVTGYKYHFELTLWPHKKRTAYYAAASISAEIM